MESDFRRTQTLLTPYLMTHQHFQCLSSEGVSQEVNGIVIIYALKALNQIGLLVRTSMNFFLLTHPFPRTYNVRVPLAHWELRGFRVKRAAFLDQVGFELEYLAPQTMP